MSETNEPITGREATAWEGFLLDWGMETYKQTVTRLDAALQRAITLATALVGGSIYFVSTDQVPPFFRVVAMFFFLAALSAALIGTMFHRETVPLDEPTRIEAFKTKVIAWRDKWVVWSYRHLAAGLYVATLGVLFRLVKLA